jgi:hypothetical protein
MWNTLWIFIDCGRSSWYATEDIFFIILKGPYRRGINFLVPFILKFFASSHTWSPSSISAHCQLFFVSRTFWQVSRCSCASFHASSNSASRLRAAGTFSSISSTLTWGRILVSNLCGVLCVTSCFHELCANSAIGSIVAQVRGRLLVQGRRYCLTQAFIRSI